MIIIVIIILAHIEFYLTENILQPTHVVFHFFHPFLNCSFFMSVLCIFIHYPGYRQGAGDAAQIKVDITACMEWTLRPASQSP